MHYVWTSLIVIAKRIHSSPNEPSGFILTTILGIVGAFIATSSKAPRSEHYPADGGSPALKPPRI
jgi:hypothetical protein